MTEPDFFATPQGADVVVARGNRRRARSAAATVGSVLAVSAVVVLAPWQGTSGRQSLTPAQGASLRPTPVRLVGPSLTPAPVASSLPPSVLASRAATPTAASTSSPGPLAASPLRTAHSGSSPITRGSSTIAATDLCSDDQTDAAQGWCIRYTGPATIRRGHPVALVSVLCRLRSFPAATVRFDSTREVRMSVQAGEDVWQAGQGGHYRSPGRTVTVPPGSCLEWRSRWDTRGRDGFLVMPGSYSVSTGVESSSATFAQGFTDVTVTD